PHIAAQREGPQVDLCRLFSLILDPQEVCWQTVQGHFILALTLLLMLYSVVRL
ncbi:unnamed protein product, partial [Ectocarpus sp. 12 AP-2014]